MNDTGQLQQTGTPEWLRPLTHEGYRVEDGASRVEVLVTIDSLIKDYRWDEVDAALQATDVSDLTEVGLILLLRGTYRFREALSGWNDFKERVSEELVSRRAPAVKLLKGL